MISRRNYLSMIIMIAVLCGIFLFVMIVQNGNAYDINEFVVKELPSGQDCWQASGDEELVLFFGSRDTALESTMKQWCDYTKRGFLRKEQISEYDRETDGLPMLILLDAEHLELGGECEELLELATLGVPMVFCTLPETSKLLESPVLREILGVEVVEEEVTVEGIRLFEGFFYGGAKDYVATTEEEMELQDFDLTVPWLITHSGTKTYMVGIMEKQRVKEGYYPCLLWRNSFEGIKVFAVCGDYMSSLSGLGILSSFLYELRPYDIYPVVNAQNVVVHNFPSFSAENEATILELYSRDPEMYFQGIMWPSISAMSKTNALRLTCLFKPEFDHADTRRPQKDEVPFYLKQLKEVTGEAGVSLSRNEYCSFEEMLKTDVEFFQSLDSQYRYQVTFAEDGDLENVKEAAEKERFLYRPVTVGAHYESGDVLLSYLMEDITLQRMTGNAKQHTYVDDFIVRSVQTALLYSNVLLDLRNAIWPQEESDQWQLFFEEMSSNVSTYWSGNSGLTQTTLSESDFRVRKFLNLDYSHERYDNEIVLTIKNMAGEVWFLLRTHEEKITQIRGGSYEKLEAGMYLIAAEDAVVEIELEPLSLKELEEE